MKESIITLLHGIKAWGDARISRLREELQRQISDAKNAALAANRKISTFGDTLGYLEGRIDGVARVPVPGMADFQKALIANGAGSYVLSDTPVLIELRPIHHTALQEAVSRIYVSSADTGASFRLHEICIQIYAPAEESATRASIKQLIYSIYAKSENDSVIRHINIFPLLTGSEGGIGFAIGYINILSGDYWVARGDESTIMDAAATYPISAAHYIGPIGLDALKQNNNIAHRVLDDTFRIQAIELSVTGLGSELPAGTEILIRGR